MSSAPVSSAAAAEQVVPTQNLLAFPRGLVGFRGPLHFSVVAIPGGDDVIKLLQCVEEPHLGFTLVDPHRFFPDYQPRPSAADLAEVDLERPEDGIWMCIATVPQDFRQATVNLRAPLLINAFRRLAKQVVLVDNHPVRQPLFRI